MSISKIEAIDLVIPEEDRASYYLPLIKHHSRWQDLEESYFTKLYDKERRGSPGRTDTNNSTETCSDPGDDYFSQDTGMVRETTELTSTEKVALEKLLSLIHDEGISLAFISIPYKQQMNLDSMQQIKINNALVAEFLGDQIPLLDMNRMWGELDFDYADLKNEGHVNKRGAEKVTAEVIDFIEQTYQYENGRLLPAD